MTTATRESAGDKSSSGQLDLRDPYDLATFEHQMIRWPLHPGLIFLMEISTPHMELLVKDFSRQFQVEAPDEVHFQAWKILEARHSQGWLAICAYHYFEVIEQCGMEFMTYIYALYRKGLPPGVSPSLMTRVRSLLSEDARAKLEEQNAVGERLMGIRDYVHAQVLGDRPAKPGATAAEGGLKISESRRVGRTRQGV